MIADLTFAHPWVFLLVPLPWVLRRMLPPHRDPRPALHVPFLDLLARLTGQTSGVGVSSPGNKLRLWLLVPVWILLVTAAARPQRLEAPITEVVPTRDLLLAVDLSGSMATEDFVDGSGATVDRLTAVKQVLDDFISRRQGDRVGLIVFGSAPFVQVPFTDDLDLCRTLLDEVQVRMAGPQTALGDAVGLAIHQFEQSEMDQRVLIVLTDGNDTGSGVSPRKAAEIAAERGITLHAVAVGDPRAAGEEKIDEDTLIAMAKTTGGAFFRAMDRDALETAYRRLDELDTREIETLRHRPKSELFFWPLGVVLGGWLILAAWRVLAAPDGTPVRRWLGAGLVVLSTVAVAWAVPAPRLGGLHFLRPGWLPVLVPAAALWWAVLRRGDPRRVWRGVIDDHLLAHLLTEPDATHRPSPAHWAGPVWLVAVIVLAGPAWRHEPTPFAEDRAAMVVALEVTPSMEADDIQPTRLARAVQKISDLVDARPGALTGLVAYAGTAHLVIPPTRDGDLVRSFAAELSPGILPVSGDDPAGAIELARDQLVRRGLPGAVVWITDGVPPDSAARMVSQIEPGPPVHILAMTTRPAAALETVASALGGALTPVTPDGRDVDRIARRVEAAPSFAADETSRQRWRDSGATLAPVVLVLFLPWLRRGWRVRYD